MLAMASNARDERLSVGAMKLPAALLIKPVSPPLANSDSTISSTACATRMSTPNVSTRRSGNCRRQPSAVSSHTALRRPQIATSAPNARNASAMPLPKPVPPPVTRMRWPFIRLAWNMAPPRRSLRTCLGERLVNVPQDVVDVLEPDRDADHVGLDAGGERLSFVELAVRGARGVADQRARVADVDQVAHELRALDERDAALQPPFD